MNARKTLWRLLARPLTMILPLNQDVLSMTVTGGLDTVAVRLPDNAATRQLIRESGKPLVGPSANTSGKASPTLAKHVYMIYMVKLLVFWMMVH